MNQTQLENKINSMYDSEFIEREQIHQIDMEAMNFIEKINDLFGDNDGEPLDQDGIKFVTELLTLRWYEANAVYEE